MISWGIGQFSFLYWHINLSSVDDFLAMTRDIFTLSFYQMYGSLSEGAAIQSPPYDMDNDGNCQNDSEIYANYSAIRCNNKSLNWLVFILLMAYLILTNTLLFNLLIALFNFKVQQIYGE